MTVVYSYQLENKPTSLLKSKIVSVSSKEGKTYTDLRRKPIPILHEVGLTWLLTSSMRIYVYQESYAQFYVLGYCSDIVVLFREIKLIICYSISLCSIS